MDKKANLSVLTGLVIALVVIGIVLAVGFSVLGKLKGTLTANSAEANATTATITAMSQIPTWLPVIVVVAVAGVILMLIKVFQQ